ncbi:segregation and condensation protein A [Candidatus Latescibacterota bacterium]
MPALTDFPPAHDPTENNRFPGEEMDSLEPDDDYRVKLSIFEGPIDLLLYLIRKKELDIHEISLSEIAREYLEYVELIKLINLESAGDFIVVASILMKIKSRSLFLAPEADDNELDEDDTRKLLIRHLMELEKLEGVAEKLAEKEDARRSVYPRGGEKHRVSAFRKEKETAPDYLLFDMLTIVRDVLRTVPQKDAHKVEILNITPEMKQNEILAAIDKHGKLDFVKMVSGQSRIIIIVTFIAVLELIKNRKIYVRQSKQFGRIMIYKRSEDERKNN